MKVFYVVIITVLLLVVLGFFRIWSKQIKNGTFIRINTWKKIMVITGRIKID